LIHNRKLKLKNLLKGVRSCCWGLWLANGMWDVNRRARGRYYEFFEENWQFFLRILNFLDPNWSFLSQNWDFSVVWYFLEPKLGILCLWNFRGSKSQTIGATSHWKLKYSQIPQLPALNRSTSLKMIILIQKERYY